ncbi:hypothetical protein E1B28_003541 [Marasmius oreades]|uniref:Major facilitator superfamily MFS-1 n=1 Tax=Marasmius oreades TaxID=181124 RepID=A0A9P7RM19_9AGAR|nr:uncharacterized protein E1B28_003541 [Marasmius oreades]KAG7086019.1 hypothetical protein E1B28_003541 [Marasmius oreades]
MTPTKAIRISIPQAFDEPEDNEGNERRQNQSSGQGSSGIPIFRSFSISDIWNRNDGAEDVNGSKARIPSIVQSSGEVYYATPLPILSMVVLSIAMLTEFLSANVAGPFMLFMVKGFGVSAEDSETAFWTGILVAMFFLTQFLTSLIWAALAEKYSPRAVLILCLLGSALSTLAFGASDTLMVAMISRLAQGVFAGSIGVTKSSIGAVTDSSNEGRAYAILGFCWGFGGVSGAVIGGTFERPAMKWPSVFGTIPFFTDFPYMLPCMVASSIMVTGSCLAYFLGPDLGPCTGKQHLTREKITIPLPAEEADGEGSSRSIKSFRYLSKKLSGIFNNPFIPDSEERMPLLFAPHTFTQNQTTCMQDQLPTGSSTPAIHRNLTYAFTTHYHGYPLDRNQTMTMESNRSSFIGQRSARDATVNGILRRPRSNHSNRSTRISYTDIEVGTAPEDYGRLSSSAAGKRLSLIDRVVLANENAHMSGIADFWVASAISLEGSNTIDDLYDVEGDVDTHSDNDDADRGRGDTRSIFSRRSVSNQRISKLADRRPFFGRQMSDSTGFPVVSVRNNMPTSPVQTRAVAHSPIRASYFDSDSRFFPRTETVDSTNNLRVEPVLRPIIESRRMSNFYSPASDHVEEGLDEEVRIAGVAFYHS